MLLKFGTGNGDITGYPAIRDTDKYYLIISFKILDLGKFTNLETGENKCVSLFQRKSCRFA